MSGAVRVNKITSERGQIYEGKFLLEGEYFLLLQRGRNISPNRR